MQNLQQILLKKQIKQSVSKRPINMNYERASVFSTSCGISIVIVLRLFKKFGAEKVLSIQPWLSDVPFDPKRGKVGLAYWKLKQITT